MGEEEETMGKEEGTNTGGGLKMDSEVGGEEFLRSLKEYSRDLDWVEDNRVELTMLFPDHYIAVKDRTVHYTEADMERICWLMRLGGDDPAHWVVAYMNVKPVRFILATGGKVR